MYEQILYDVADPIATLTLNRPKQLNAWTDRMARELRHALARAESDPAVVGIILTGAERGFCAGADLQLLSSMSEGGARAAAESDALAADPGDPDMDAGFRQAYSYLASIRKPIIAAINGPCAGLALPIALGCDLRFASDRAVFTAAFPQRGLIAEWGIAWLLPRVVGTGHALDLILSGRKIDAAEAERIGLVNRALPHDALLEHARRYVRALAERCSPSAMRVSKRQVYESLGDSLETAYEKARREMLQSLKRPDFREGVRAFRERRPPRFPREP